MGLISVGKEREERVKDGSELFGLRSQKDDVPTPSTYQLAPYFLEVSLKYPFIREAFTDHV